MPLSSLADTKRSSVGFVLELLSCDLSTTRGTVFALSLWCVDVEKSSTLEVMATLVCCSFKVRADGLPGSICASEVNRIVVPRG